MYRSSPALPVYWWILLTAYALWTTPAYMHGIAEGHQAHKTIAAAIECAGIRGALWETAMPFMLSAVQSLAKLWLVSVLLVDLPNAWLLVFPIPQTLPRTLNTGNMGSR